MLRSHSVPVLLALPLLRPGRVRVRDPDRGYLSARHHPGHGRATHRSLFAGCNVAAWLPQQRPRPDPDLPAACGQRDEKLTGRGPADAKPPMSDLLTGGLPFWDPRMPSG